MYYCQDCHMPYEQDICPECGVQLPLAKEDDDCFLVEKKEDRKSVV